MGEWPITAVRDRIANATEAGATLGEIVGRSLSALYGVLDEYPTAFRVFRAQQLLDQGGVALFADVARTVAGSLLGRRDSPPAPGIAEADSLRT